MLDASPTAAPHAHARSTLPRGAVITAALLTVTLAVAGGGYGFHRDELYFIEAGLHQAWGYPDQPAAAPLLAAGWHRLVGGSLWAFRLLPAVLAGLIVLVAAATSAQLGGTQRHQVITAVLTALSTTILVNRSPVLDDDGRRRADGDHGLAADPGSGLAARPPCAALAAGRARRRPRPAVQAAHRHGARRVRRSTAARGATRTAARPRTVDCGRTGGCAGGPQPAVAGGQRLAASPTTRQGCCPRCWPPVSRR